MHFKKIPAWANIVTAVIRKDRQRRFFLPIFSVLAAIALDLLLPRSIDQKTVAHPYFTWFLALTLGVYLFLYFARGESSWREYACYRAPFYAGVTLLANVVNLLTAKFAVLPVLYFPAPDRVLAVLAEDTAYLATCVLYSCRLLFIGWTLGALIGICTGVLLGFSKTASYWITPFIRSLGPIPPTAWIPLVLVVFPTVVSGSVFLIGLSVWFPTAVLTNSGIANIKNSYFEMASTLGAGRFFQIFRIGLPAALPSVFLGLFNGTCSSFITLVTAEMLGARYGLGWYINWQKEMMAYANVYAGLILIAVSFSCIITGLFRIRNRLLIWQKGVVKW